MTEDPAPIAYATPARRPASVGASAVLAVTGLGLIFLGGCFLIGVLVLFEPTLAFGPPGPPVWTPGRVGFCVALSSLAAVSFVGSAVVLVPTVRLMLGVLRSAR